MSGSKRPIPQSGVIPYRVRRNQYEVLLITASRRQRWVIPKGLIGDQMTPSDSAAREAYEEAGVRGRLSSRSVGVYRYEKWGTWCEVKVYLMEVTEVLRRWPESPVRKRRWLKPEKAAAMVWEDDLQALLTKLPALVKSKM